MDVLSSIIFAVVGLSILIIAHESGHYFVARAFGMRVLRYSIGIGPALFRYKPKNSPTTFQVCAVPFLAYVQIAGMNPQEDNDPDDPDVFQNKSLFARVATVAAGPVANYLTAVVLIFGLALVGWPGPERTPMEIEEVSERSPAEQAGIKPGDVIVAAEGKPVRSTADLIDITENRAGLETNYRVRRGEKEFSFDITPGTRVEMALGIAVDAFPDPDARVSTVLEDSPAAKAGFKEGDIIVAAGGEAIESAAAFAAYLKEHGIPRDYAVSRNGARRSVEINADVSARYFKEKAFAARGIIGVLGSTGPMAMGDAAAFALVFPAKITAESIGGLLSMATAFDADAIAGPVKLGKHIADSASLGVSRYVQMLAILSVALGFFNLLPFPALDGGRLAFLAYEAVTRQQPNAKVEALVHLIGIMFLLAVLVLVTLRDIRELFS